MALIDTNEIEAAPQRAPRPLNERQGSDRKRQHSPTKSETVFKLLSRPKGATIADMRQATGWQPHSVRAFLSGLRKKGWALARETQKDGVACYQLITSNSAPATPGAGE